MPPTHRHIVIIVVVVVKITTYPLYGAIKAGSNAGLAVVAGRISADVDGHRQVELGQLTIRMASDRSSAVHCQTTQLVDAEHRHAVPRVQVDSYVAPVREQKMLMMTMMMTVPDSTTPFLMQNYHVRVCF